MKKPSGDGNNSQNEFWKNVSLLLCLVFKGFETRKKLCLSLIYFFFVILLRGCFPFSPSLILRDSLSCQHLPYYPPEFLKVAFFQISNYFIQFQFVKLEPLHGAVKKSCVVSSCKTCVNKHILRNEKQFYF